jgi:hypothetical protein
VSGYRIQVTVGYTLVAEAVLETAEEAHATAVRYLNLRNRRGLPMGGCGTQRADLPRYWDVPVGGTIERRWT